MSFDEFVVFRSMRNSWVQEPGIELYVRRSIPSRGTDFDLANMNADRPGSGALTAFLDKYEPLYSFYIENLLNPRLVPYFEKRGYTQIDVRENIVQGMKKIPKEI
jgi:hypothetical protein